MKTIRLSTLDDIPLILQMFGHSRQIMRANGNTFQWPDGYPTAEMVRRDIDRFASHIIEEDGRPVGTFALVIGIDPTYLVIEQGAWKDDTLPYGTIHRLACMPGVKGIADCCFDYCKQQIGNLRADTHEANKILQHILDKHDFEYCGIIHIADGTPRRAYQWRIKI
ncbi:MAG: GNAT family N-acetyltransferase [Bacteroidales bacterium]|nr:GNAT family N-acetyltransferase [Bacteroidales bacterium]